MRGADKRWGLQDAPKEGRRLRGAQPVGEGPDKGKVALERPPVAVSSEAPRPREVGGLTGLPPALGLPDNGVVAPVVHPYHPDVLAHLLRRNRGTEKRS